MLTSTYSIKLVIASRIAKLGSVSDETNVEASQRQRRQFRELVGEVGVRFDVVLRAIAILHIED